MDSIVQAVATYAMSEKTAVRPMIMDGMNDINYGDAWKVIKATATRLQGEGLKKGDCCMLMCTQDVNYMMSVLACQLAGIITVPLEKGASEGRMKNIYEETQAVLFLGPDDPNLGLRWETYDKYFSDYEALKEEGSKIADDAFTFPVLEDVAEILFTTGTTGKPKGIVLAHQANIAIAENVTKGVEMPADNIEIVPMPLSHSHGLRRTYANLYNGSAAVLINGVILIKKLFQMIEDYKVTAIDISPAILNMLFKLSKNKLGEYKDQIQYVQLGSATLPEENKLKLMELLPNTRLYNFYGTTEAGCSCILDFNGNENREHCIGVPAANAKFIFTDEERNPVEATKENPGFLATAGKQNMVEYLNSPELTAETCGNGYIYTNDLGYMDEEGYIYCLGRRDDVINCGGIKISPDEIETEVLYHKSIKDCACVPIKDKIQGQVPKLFIELSVKEKDFDPAEFRDFLKKKLDSNKVPKKIEIIDQIPRTYNGKIQRKKLLEK